MAIIPKGQEPASVKKRIDTLFPKLNEAYPNKVIVSLQRDHKKWDETAREISKQLGYESKNEFLIAYGYKIENSVGGRPKTTDGVAVIGELKKRYPNGSPFSTLGELQDANPDLASQFKTLSNQANELFGMTLAKYLKDIGLLGKKQSQNTKEELDILIAELKKRYPKGSTLPETVAQLKEENSDLAMKNLSYIEQVYDISPKEYLTKLGLIKESNPSAELEAFVGTIQERYAGKCLPSSLNQLKQENGDLSFYNATKWAKEAFGISLNQYLTSKNIICIGNRNLYIAEKEINPNTLDNNKNDTIEFFCRAFVTTGLDDSQEEKIRTFVQSQGGFFRTSVSRNTDYLITDSSVPQMWETQKYKTAKEFIEKGVNIQILTFEKYMKLATQYAQNPSKPPEYLVEKGVLVRYVGNNSIVVIPDDVVEIGGKAFAGCQNVTEVKLNRNIKRITRNAFNDCKTLKKVSIVGDNWEDIYIQSFHQYVSSSINFVNMPEFYIKNGELLRYFGTNKIINIPGEVEIIGNSAFKNNDIVEVVNIGKHVTSILDEAFANCQNLRKVMLPNTMYEIAKRAFCKCINLVEVSLPDNLTVLGEAAFEECFAIKEIKFPSNITSIPDSVCYHCKSLSHIVFGKNVSKIANAAFCGCSALPVIALPNDLKEIGESAFAACENLSEISLPQSLKHLRSRAFSYCISLGQIQLSNKLKKIDDEAFFYCTSLKEVEFSENLTKIEDSCFEGCSSLSRIVMYEGLKTIGEYAFKDCISLTEQSFVVVNRER